jgi:hypothetical protein
VTESDTEETTMMSPNTNTPTDVTDTTKKEPHCTSSATVSSKMSAPIKGSFNKSLKQKSDNTLDAVHQAITSLKEVFAANNEGEFSEYARHVATQLRKLPLVNSLRLQEKIQNLIIEERISCVTGAANSYYNRLMQEAVSQQIRSPACSVSSCTLPS